MKRQPEPLPAPYPVGTRLRYTGRLCIEWYPGRLILGATGCVTETHPGWRGTGRVLDYDDDGEPIIDTTHDGWSVVVLDPGTNPSAARAIPPDSTDWEVIADDRPE